MGGWWRLGWLGDGLSPSRGLHPSRCHRCKIVRDVSPLPQHVLALTLNNAIKKKKSATSKDRRVQTAWCGRPQAHASTPSHPRTLWRPSAQEGTMRRRQPEGGVRVIRPRARRPSPPLGAGLRPPSRRRPQSPSITSIIIRSCQCGLHPPRARPAGCWTWS